LVKTFSVITFQGVDSITYEHRQTVLFENTRAVFHQGLTSRFRIDYSHPASTPAFENLSHRDRRVHVECRQEAQEENAEA
jgi:hypothetical protein